VPCVFIRLYLDFLQTLQLTLRPFDEGCREPRVCLTAYLCMSKCECVCVFLSLSLSLYVSYNKTSSLFKRLIRYCCFENPFQQEPGNDTHLPNVTLTFFCPRNSKIKLFARYGLHKYTGDTKVNLHVLKTTRTASPV